MPGHVLCTLPGGWLDREGALQREVLLRPLRGEDEEWLHTLPSQTPQARVLAALLARCVKRIGPHRASRARLRTLLSGDGDFLALRLHRLTFGDKVEWVLVCPDPACGKKMDLDFDARLLPVRERPPQPRYTLRLGPPEAAEACFRLPRLGDLEDAARAPEPLRLLLSRCLLTLDGVAVEQATLAALSPDAWQALGDEMERVSPGVEETLEASCPDCGREFTTEFDPTALLVGGLSQRRREFDQDVHLLSLHYHWPLGEILRLSRERRQRYVRLLTNALDATSGLSASLG